MLTRNRIDAINCEFAPGGNDPILPGLLTEADLLRHGHHISRRHFALALQDKGIKEKSIITRIIGNDSPAYIPSGAPLEALCDYLQKWPLVKVLAHPAAGSYPGDSHYKEVLPPFETVEKLLPRFLDSGLDGLEIYYPAHTSEWIQRLESLRIYLGLPLATGGSDCHDRRERPLGVCGVPLLTVRKMQSIFEEKRRK